MLEYYLPVNKSAASQVERDILENLYISPLARGLYIFHLKAVLAAKCQLLLLTGEMFRPRFLASLRPFLNLPVKINSYFIDQYPQELHQKSYIF